VHADWLLKLVLPGHDGVRLDQRARPLSIIMISPQKAPHASLSGSVTIDLNHLYNSCFRSLVVFVARYH